MSVIVTAADRAPASAGVKCPWMVQAAPTARLEPQVLANTNDEAFVPVTAMLMIDSADALVLVIVTDCDALVVPTCREAYERLVADKENGGADTPVPVSAMDCGELPALSLMVTAARSAPVCVGVKWPWMVQLAPAARLEPQVLANTNDEAFVPVTAMLMIGNGDPPVLDRVTDCDALVVPTCWVPYERLVADSETVDEEGGLRARVMISGAAIPLPVSHCP